MLSMGKEGGLILTYLFKNKYAILHTKVLQKIRLRERANTGALRPTSQALELAFVIVV